MEKHKFIKSFISPGNKTISLLLVLTMVLLSVFPVIAVGDSSLQLRQQTFTLTPEEGVTVTLSGLLPSGGSAEAKPANVEGDNVLHAYDITIFDARHADFEPADGQPIDVSFQSDAIKRALADGSNDLTVEHITDSGKTEEVELTFAEDDEVSFSADSFSIYVIRDHDNDDTVQTPRKTFYFLSQYYEPYLGTDEGHEEDDRYVSGLYTFPNNQNEMVSSQIVCNNETLHPIVMPENFDWGYFYGWYEVELDLEASKQATSVATGTPVGQITEDTLTKFVYSWDDEPVSVDAETPIEVTEDKTVYLAPLYSNYRFLSFHETDHDEEGHCTLIARKLLALGHNQTATVDISDVTAISPDPQKLVFYGWEFKGQIYQTRLSTGDAVHQEITVAADDADEDFSINLYPVFKEARWITFVHGEQGWNAQYLGAIFAYLYDESIPEADRVSLTQLPTTTRPGYIFDGWYTGHMEAGDDGIDHIVYEQQVSMALDDASVVGNSNIIPTAGETINIGHNNSYICMGHLYLHDEMTLYAKWRPLNAADYKVVVWMQDVTDDKDATDDQKTYDYYTYKLMEDYPSNTIVLDSEDYQALGFENLKNSTDTTIQNDFYGFHYSRTEVVVNGVAYDGSIPEERVKGLIMPDSSTVVNVYYDRDLTLVNFHYSSTTGLPTGAKSDTYLYTGTTETSGTQYGYDEQTDQFVALTRIQTDESYYTYRYDYVPSENDNETMYGVVNGEYVLLTQVPIYGQWNREYTYTPVSNNNNTQYGIVNNSFVTLTRSGTFITGYRWTYNNTNYSGTRYTRSSNDHSAYSGTRYVFQNNTLVESTNETDPQYGKNGNTIYSLTPAVTGYYYTYNGAQYDGARYTRTQSQTTDVQYNGVRYEKSNGTFTETESESGTLYGIRNGVYEELAKKTETHYSWTMSGQEYTGVRCTRERDTTYNYRLTWVGLYGQTFGQNDYDWSTVNNVSWQAKKETGTGNITQTLLDGFTEKANPYTLKENGTPGSYTIYHYKQGLDGKYSTSARYEAHSNGGTFNFSNKFDDFTVTSYSSSYDPDAAGATPVPASNQASLPNPAHIYHTRNKHDLTLVNFTTANNSPDEPNDKVITGIYYEAPLSPYNLTPPARANYTFGGWYLDKGCTKAVDFTTATMPSGNMFLYAKWDLKYYFVEIDPDGGEMEDQLEFSQYTGFTSPRKQSTYTWLQYGRKISEYANVERTYVPDNSGDYVYVNVKFAPTFAEAAEKDWDYSLPSKLRAAFYCKATELDAVYEHFKDANGNYLISRDEFNAYCVDLTKLYRKATGVEGYSLYAWFKVNDDGTTSNEMYHFGDTVTKPTRIRAVWRRTGEFFLEYNPYNRRYGIGRDVEIDGEMQHNEIFYDPARHESEHYLDGSETTVLHQPNYIPERYVFRGWRLLDRDGDETEFIFNVSSIFVIDSRYADDNGVIHLEAVYEPEKETVRRPETTALILDANTTHGGHVVKGDLSTYQDDPIHVSMSDNQVQFIKQENNFKVDLHDYYNNFAHSNGYMLLGWNDTPDPGDYIPTYAADAEIGINSDGDTPNILYAVWEPMYYLTLENYSTEYDITFNLKFTDYSGDTVYSGNSNSVLSVFERVKFSDYDKSDINVQKIDTNNFTVTMMRATAENAPNHIKLVLPEGENAKYTVTGNISNAVTDGNQTLKSKNGVIYVYNSGGASDKIYPVTTGTGYWATTTWYNLAGASRAEEYNVSGRMKLSQEGQTVAFYTEQPDTVSVHLQALYYDVANSKWEDDLGNGTGPDSTLSFTDYNGLGGEPSVDGHHITNIDIIKRTGNSFGISETYTKTNNYKFIGWYTTPYAAPDSISLDGYSSTFGAPSITGIPVPNEFSTTFYALYVPYTDAYLRLTHDEMADSIGYPKRIGIGYEYGNDKNDSITTTYIDNFGEHINDRAKSEISVNLTEPRTADEANASFKINLVTVSGYGCVYYETFEGEHRFSRDICHKDDKDEFDKKWYVHEHPNKDDPELDHYTNTPDCEPKSHYRYTIEKTVGELFVDSETVKGLKVLSDINYYSDYERNYEFVYNYKFRDGTTQRKYLVKGSTPTLKSQADFERFVATSAPYVSNFGEDLAWDTSSVKVKNLFEKGKVTAEMDAVQSNNAKAIVSVKKYGTDVTIPWSITVGTAFPEDKRPVADLIVNDRQFWRWEIKETKTDKLIGYCYYNEFTFMVWDDYTITPEYCQLQEDGEYHRIYPDDETESYIKMTYLESTRNQWVDLDEDDDIIYDESGNATFNDALISDFSITYIDKGQRINSNPDAYKVGLIYEIVGEIKDVSSPGIYDVQPNDTLRGKALASVVQKANGTTGTIRSGGQTKFYYSQFDPTKLTHDNRIEYYRGIDNLIREDNTLNPNATYAFNVYAYMKLPNGDIIQSDPVTLQLYHLATRTIAG